MQAVTLEHVHPGRPPAWLYEVALAQSKQPDSPRLLFLHPTDAARQQFLSRASQEMGMPVDRERHHTLDSLVKSLAAVLRLPRLLPRDGVMEVLAHHSCVAHAGALGFPRLHPDPEGHWGKGRTRAVAALSQGLAEEGVRDFDGPGLVGWRQVTKGLEQRLGGTHPDRLLSEVTDRLRDAPEAPFGLHDLAGVILLDHPPTMTRALRRLLDALRVHVPIHQLCHHGSLAIGNHRLGLHGMILEDVHPVRSTEGLPDWVPAHSVWDVRSQAHPAAAVQRLIIPDAADTMACAREVLHDWRAESADGLALIIDPDAESRREIWRRELGRVGLALAPAAAPLCTAPTVHWILAMAGLGHSQEGFSLARLRAIGAQRSLPLTSDWLRAGHPTRDDWQPRPHFDHLALLARNWHIVGGPGALAKWLRALAAAPRISPSFPEDLQETAAEETQWWLLSLAHRLAPLLHPLDRAALKNEELRTGCVSKQTLPLPKSPTSGDAWLQQLARTVDWTSLMARQDGGPARDVAGLQQLLAAHRQLRDQQRLLGISAPRGGMAWVDELTSIIEGGVLPAPEVARDGVLLLTPADALGVEADLTLLTHLTLDDWPLRARALPWMDAESCAMHDICRPDAPLRAGRHQFESLLHSAPDVLLIDASLLDDECQPATPISELLATHAGADAPEEVRRPQFLEDEERWPTIARARSKGHHLYWRPYETLLEVHDGVASVDERVHGRAGRDSRQRIGIDLRHSRLPESAPTHAATASIALEPDLAIDRLERMPKLPAEGEAFLRPAIDPRIVGMPKDPLHVLPRELPVEKRPRLNPFWPVRGGKRQWMTDPRPLRPHATELPVHDARMGHLSQPCDDRVRWSPSRLEEWLGCPRKGWLSRRLRATEPESVDDDLDVRVRGELVHGALAHLFEIGLDLDLGVEIDPADSGALADVDESPEVWMSHLLEYIADAAPWMDREDATATHRRHDLIGMDRATWLDWLASPRPMPPSGRLGRLLTAELDMPGAYPLAMEWEIPRGTNVGIELGGFVDRVDWVPCEDGERLDPECATVAPLDLTESDWRPARLILIRDVKTMDGPKPSDIGKRHRKGLYDGLQLALYARAWEVAHPGDLVIGCGISEVGTKTTHIIEVDAEWADVVAAQPRGKITHLTRSSHRFPDTESPGEADDGRGAFRAWLAERLRVACGVAEAANGGRVHATPSDSVCTFCSVQAACGLAPTVGGDKSWN